MLKNKQTSCGLFNKIFQILLKIPFLQNIRSIFYFIDILLLVGLPKPQMCHIQNKKNVLIVFPFALGDCILFGASAQYYRQLYTLEEFDLTFLLPSGCEQLFGGYADHLVTFDFTKASVNLGYRRKIFKKLREQYYDIVIDPYPCIDCTPNIYMTRAVCAGQKIGFTEVKHKKTQCPIWMRQRIYHLIYSISEENLHRIVYYRKVLEILGAELETMRCMNIPSVKLECKLPQNYFVVFPSASVDAKKWEFEKYLELIRRIVDQYDIPLVLVGTAKDKQDTDRIIKHFKDVEITDLVGKTNVLEYCEVIGKSQFIVTNDTSAYHIAVAKDVKTFLISGGYVFDMFANYPRLEMNKNQPSVIYKGRACFNCDNYCKYKFKDRYPCVAEIEVEDVWNCIRHDLEEKGE